MQPEPHVGTTRGEERLRFVMRPDQDEKSEIAHDVYGITGRIESVSHARVPKVTPTKKYTNSLGASTP